MISRRTRIRHLRSSYESLRISGVGFEQAMTSWARGLSDEALALLSRRGFRRLYLVAGLGVQKAACQEREESREV